MTALLAHAVVLHRLDAGARAECFYLMAPDAVPPVGQAALNGATAGAQPMAMPRAAALPLLFHRDGGFWQRDRASGRDAPLATSGTLDRVQQSGIGMAARFVPTAYPEARADRRSVDRRSLLAAALSA